MTLGKHEYAERKDAGEMLLRAVMSGQYAGKVIGFYRGFEIIPLERKYLTDSAYIELKGALTHRVELSDSDVGSIARIENGLERLERYRDDDLRETRELQRRLEASKIQLTRPFEQEQELADTLAELSKVNAELDVDRGADDGALLDEGENEQDEDDALELDEGSDEDEPEM